MRLAGGREVHLRSMQPLALNLANSIFLGDYLTTEGQSGQSDLDMIKDAGFEVEGADTTTLPEHRAPAGGGCGSHEGSCGPCGEAPEAASEATAVAAAEPSEVLTARTDLVAVRRRGAGTDLAPNA